MLGLKVAVVGMGVLIVAGVIGLAVVMTQRLSGLATAPLAATLDEPAGTRIAGVSAGGDRLAVQLQGGGPDRVVVFDLKAGKVSGRVELAR